MAEFSVPWADNRFAMVDDPEKLIIVEADKMHGDLLIHFSSGKSVLYHAQFLRDVREHDGNVALLTMQQRRTRLSFCPSSKDKRPSRG